VSAFGQLDTTTDTAKQLYAELFLKLTDLSTDRTMSDMQVFGRTRNTAFARGCIKGPQRIE
jgi:hypothetical protein